MCPEHPPPGLTQKMRQPWLRRFRGLLECAFSVSLCHCAGQFKKAAALFFCAAAGGIGGKRMTIRALVKTSNTVQLFLPRLLAACPGGERRRGKN